MDNSAFLTMSALFALFNYVFFFFFKYSKVTGSLDLYS